MYRVILSIQEQGPGNDDILCIPNIVSIIIRQSNNTELRGEEASGFPSKTESNILQRINRSETVKLEYDS